MTRASSFAAAALLAVGAASASACSVLLDWNGLSDAAGDGGASDATSPDGSDGASAEAATCASNTQCVTAPPSGWAGPIALLEAPSTQAPAPCGACFAATPIFEGHADLTAAAATCAPCGCGTPGNESCTGPVLSFFKEDTCNTPCGTPVTLGPTCTVTDPNCRGVVIGSPSPTGGACAPSGGGATKPPVSWGRFARACAAATTPNGSGCAAGQVCVPPSTSPFGARACVMQPGAATACPVEYPVGPRVYYGDVADGRGCSACTCGGASGGHCTGSASTGAQYIGFPCVARNGDLAAPASCASFQGGESVMLLNAPTLDVVGACAADGGAPTGSAQPSTPMSFCCGL